MDDHARATVRERRLTVTARRSAARSADRPAVAQTTGRSGATPPTRRMAPRARARARPAPARARPRAGRCARAGTRSRGQRWRPARRARAPRCARPRLPPRRAARGTPARARGGRAAAGRGPRAPCQPARARRSCRRLPEIRRRTQRRESYEMRSMRRCERDRTWCAYASCDLRYPPVLSRKKFPAHEMSRALSAGRMLSIRLCAARSRLITAGSCSFRVSHTLGLRRVC